MCIKMEVTYKEIRAKQKRDISIYYNIYRKLSTPLTYVFVKLGISPSAVSILSFFPCLIGYFFLSAGTYAFIVIGLLFFILYKVLDCSDGEVARIQNPKAMDPLHKITEGPYFDAVAHFIEPICLGAGLGIGLFYLYNSRMYITLGILFAILFTLEYALKELVRSYFRRGIIERKIRLNKELKYVQKQLMDRISEGHSWSEQNIFLKLFGIYPPGLIYSREFIVPILILLVIIEYSLTRFTDFPQILYGQTIGILSVYLFIVGFVKLIKVVRFISKLKKNKYITNLLNEL